MDFEALCVVVDDTTAATFASTLCSTATLDAHCTNGMPNVNDLCQDYDTISALTDVDLM